MYLLASRDSTLHDGVALARWAVQPGRNVTTSTRPDPHPIRDFFIAELIDYAPKDHTDMMERPFFSIAKRKRLKPIEYENHDGSVFVSVSGHPESPERVTDVCFAVRER